MNMQNNNNNNNTPALPKHAVSFGLSLAVCSVVNALLVIAKEKNPGIQQAMQKLTGHHWITHSSIVLILFVVLGFVIPNISIPANRLIKIVLAGIVIPALLIIGFYLFAD
jgi:hypothetical protein